MPNHTRKATVCSVEGCDAGGYMTRGLCKMHYARLRRHGDPGTAGKQHAVSWEGVACQVDGCDRRVTARGYCLAHYKRSRRWGDPKVRRVAPIEERFAARVTVGDFPDGRPGLGPCEVWTGNRMVNGYGVLSLARGVTVLAHRWAYEHFVGPIPEGLVIDHLCRVRHCVNPDHLEAVTNEENLRRGAGYGLRNGMRSACINGHEYTPENTYTHPTKGSVRCRECARAHDRKRKSA